MPCYDQKIKLFYELLYTNFLEKPNLWLSIVCRVLLGEQVWPVHTLFIICQAQQISARLSDFGGFYDLKSRTQLATKKAVNFSICF